MILAPRTFRSWCALLCLTAPGLSSPARAQHFDVQVQQVASVLTTGAADFDSGSFSQGLRVWTRSFNTTFAVNNPGFNSVGETTGTLPPGASALPGNRDLQWDFLPIKVGPATSNLLYWNTVGAAPGPVDFGGAPTADYSLSLFGKNNVRSAADGTSRLVPGGAIDTTAADGFLHAHRFFFLDDDHDDNNATTAAPGVYLVAMRLRMEGVDRSDPFYIVWGTPAVPIATLETARAWVDERVDQLSPNFGADFDGDLDVDGADLLTWQRGLSASGGALQTTGDANADHTIDAADLAVWRDQFGSSLATFQGAQAAQRLTTIIPEPATIALALAGLLRGRRPARCRQARP